MSATSAFTVKSWQDLPRAIVACEQAGAVGQAHLLRALMAGRIAYLPLLPETSAAKFKGFAHMTTHRPAVVLIPDDDYRDQGPGGWHLAKRAIGWARRVLIHGAGARVSHYEALVDAAQSAKRALMIECSSATEAAWAELVMAMPHRPKVLMIRSTDGPHPIVPSRDWMQ